MFSVRALHFKQVIILLLGDSTAFFPNNENQVCG